MRRFGSILSFLLVLSLVGCDHGTKHLAKAHLGREGIPLIHGVLELIYTENRDTAFSLLGTFVSPQLRYPLLTGAGVLTTLVVMAYFAWNWRRSGSAQRIGGLLVIAGAIGNVSDRLFRGYVVDFVHVNYWPVFNVADIAVTLGVAVLLWRGGFGHRSTPRVAELPTAP